MKFLTSGKGPCADAHGIGGTAQSRTDCAPLSFETRFKIRIERPEGPLETEGWARDLSESGLGAFVATPIILESPLPCGSPWVTALS